MSQTPIYFAADDKLVQALSEPLRKAGLALQSFRTQAELIAACESARPGVVLLGAKLPDGTAITAQQLLGPKRVPCVVILGPSQAGSRASLFRAGFADVAFSPIRPRQLAVRLAELAGGSRNADPLQPADLPARVSVGGRSAEGRLVQLSRDAIVISLPAIPPKSVAAEISIQRDASSALGVFGSVLEAQTEQGSARVSFRLLGVTAEEEAALLSLTSAANASAGVPSAAPAKVDVAAPVAAPATPPRIEKVAASRLPAPAAAPASAPVQTPAPSPVTSAPVRAVRPSEAPAASVPPAPDGPAVRPPESSPQVDRPSDESGLADAAASPGPVLPPVPSAPSEGATDFAAALFDEVTPAGPAWPIAAPTLEGAAASAKSAFELFRRRLASGDAGQSAAATDAAHPTLDDAANAIVRQLTAAEREVLESTLAPVPAAVPADAATLSAPSEPAGAGVDVPPDALPAASVPETAGAAEPAKQSLNLSPELAALVARATAHRIRLTAVALTGRALAGTREPGAPPVAIAEHLVQGLTGDADGWAKEFKPHLDKTLTSGQVALLKELNATQAGVNRAVLELRNVVRLLRGEAEEMLGGALDVSVAATAESAAPPRPKPTASVGAVRFHDASKPVPTPSTVKWAVPLLVGLGVLSVVLNFFVFDSGPVKEKPVSVPGIAGVQNHGRAVIIRVAPGFGTSVKLSNQEILALVRQQRADTAQLFTPDGMPVGTVDAVAGTVMLFPFAAGGPGEAGPGGLVVPAMAPPGLPVDAPGAAAPAPPSVGSVPPAGEPVVAPAPANGGDASPAAAPAAPAEPATNAAAPGTAPSVNGAAPPGSAPADSGNAKPAADPAVPGAPAGAPPPAPNAAAPTPGPAAAPAPAAGAAANPGGPAAPPPVP